MRKYRSNIAV